MMMGMILMVMNHVDQDGFVPSPITCTCNGHEQDLDDNRSIRSALSTSSPSSLGGWLNNPNLLNGNYAASRSAMRDLAGGFGHTPDIMQSLKAGLFNGIPVVKNLTSYLLESKERQN